MDCAGKRSCHGRFRFLALPLPVAQFYIRLPEDSPKPPGSPFAECLFLHQPSLLHYIYRNAPSIRRRSLSESTPDLCFHYLYRMARSDPRTICAVFISWRYSSSSWQPRRVQPLRCAEAVHRASVLEIRRLKANVALFDGKCLFFLFSMFVWVTAVGEERHGNIRMETSF